MTEPRILVNLLRSDEKDRHAHEAADVLELQRLRDRIQEAFHILPMFPTSAIMVSVKKVLKKALNPPSQPKNGEKK